MARVTPPISIPEPVANIDSLWKTSQVLKEAVEVLQGIRGTRAEVLAQIDTTIVQLEQSIEGSDTLFELSDTDIFGQAQGDLIFNSDGLVWAHTAGELIWNPTLDYLQLANNHSINWLDSNTTSKELLVFENIGGGGGVITDDYFEQDVTERQVTSSTYVDAPGGLQIIDKSTITDAERYFFVVNTGCGNSITNNTNDNYIRLTDDNGASTLAGSEGRYTEQHEADGDQYGYSGTFVNSTTANDIKVQLKQAGSVQASVSQDFRAWAFNVSKFNATQFYETEDTTTRTSVTVYPTWSSTSTASVTVGAGDWLFMSHAKLTFDSGTFRISHVGLVDDVGTEIVDYGEWRAENTAAEFPTSHWWYEAGLTGSNVRKTAYAQNTDGQSTITHAHIAAVSLNALEEYYVTQDLAVYGAGSVGSGDTTRLNINFTAQNTGEFVALAMIKHSWNASGSSGQQRIDVNINAAGATTVSSSSQFHQWDNTRKVQMQCIPIASFSVTQGDSVVVDYIHTSAASDTTQTLEDAQLVVFALEVSSTDTLIVGDPEHDNLIDGTATKIDSTLNVTGATDLDSTLNVDGAATFQSTTDHFDGSTWHVQTGVSPITIDGDVGDTTTPMIDILNTGTNVDRRLIRFREEANEGFYIDGDFSLSNPNNALVIGTDIVGAVGEMLWMKQDGDWRFGTDRVVYDYSARLLDMPSTDIDLGNGAFGDRINFYGGLDGALSASIGNESTIDIFLKAAQVHRWYVGTNADLGASNYMYLNTSELGLERDIDLFQADAATATHSWRSAWNNPDYDWTFTGTTDLNISGLTNGVVLASGVDLTVGGDLTVSGTTTTINSNTVAIADNIILLNSDEAGAPTQDAGLEVERGTSPNVFLQYDETSDRWEFTNDGSTYYDLMTMADGTVTDSVLRWSGTAWNEETLVRVSDAGAFSIFDSDTTDSVVMSHSGGVTPSRVFTIATTNTDYVDITGIVNPGGLRLRDGAQFEIYDPTDTGYLFVKHDGTDVSWTGVNTTDFTVDGLTWFKLLAGGGLAIYDSTNADEANFSHDGTYFNINTVTTDAIRIAENTWITGGNQFRIYDGSGLDYGVFAHDGTDFDLAFVNSGVFRTELDGLTTGATWSDGGASKVIFDKSGLVQLRDGWSLRLYDSTDTDYANFSHDGTNFNTSFVQTTTWDIDGVNVLVDTAASGWFNVSEAGLTKFQVNHADNRVEVHDGYTLRIYDAADTDFADFSHDGTNFYTAFTTTADWNVTGADVVFQTAANTTRNVYITEAGVGYVGAQLQYDGLNNVFNIMTGNNPPVTRMSLPRDAARVELPGSVLRIANGANYADFSHDGTDLNTAFTTTTDWNITGITVIQAGTVDADFDAITATSYGGILEANLLDKTASETVSGSYTFSTRPILTANGGGAMFEGAAPGPRWHETDAAVDEGEWWMVADGGTISLRAYNDAFSLYDNAIIINRTGRNVDEVNFFTDTSTERLSVDSLGINVTGDVSGTTIGGILEANLLDKTANEIVSGEWDFTDAISVQGNVSDKGIVGAFVFMDMNGGTGRFGSYNWDAPGWVDCYYTGANVFANAQAGSVQLQTNNTTRATVSGTQLLLASGIDLAFGAVTDTIAGIQNQNLVDKTVLETVSGQWDFFSGLTTGQIRVGRNTNEHLTFQVQDNNAVITYTQDEVATEAHSLYFNISSGASGNHLYQWQINATAEMTLDATSFTAGNYVFDTDQTLGVGQDGYVLTYTDSTGEISFTAAGTGTVTSATGADNRVAVFTSATNIEGDASFTWDSSTASLTLFDTLDTDSFVIQQTTGDAKLQSTQHIWLSPGTGGHMAYVYRSGSQAAFRVYDGTGNDYWSVSHDGTNANTIFAGTNDWDIISLTNGIRLRDGAYFRVYDSTDTDYAEFSHDGTDFNTAFTNTAEWNFTGGVDRWTYDEDLSIVKSNQEFRVTTMTNSASTTTTWYKVAEGSIPSGTFQSLFFHIRCTEWGSNHGHNGDKSTFNRYYAGYTRSQAVEGDTDTGYAYGTEMANPEIRISRTALGEFELQFKPNAANKSYMLEIVVDGGTTYSPGWITWFDIDSKVAGDTLGTITTPSSATNVTDFERFFNLHAVGEFVIYNDAGTDTVTTYHDGTDVHSNYVNTSWQRFTNLTSGILFQDGIETRWYDSSDTNYLSIAHVGTEANIVGSVSTTTLNVADVTLMVDTNTGAQPFYVSRVGSTPQSFEIYVDDAHTHLTARQDEVGAENHSVIFDNLSGSTGEHSYLFRDGGVDFFSVHTVGGTVETEGRVIIRGAAVGGDEGSSLVINTSNPQFSMDTPSGAANEKVWNWIADAGGTYRLRTLDDTYGAGEDIFTIDRTGTTVDTFTFNNGNVVITDNLTVNGTTTTINSNTVSIADNIIVLNSDEAGAPTANAGIEVERGTSANVQFYWNETSDRWQIDTGGLYLNNTNLIAVNNIVFNDAGPGEGLQWDSWQVYESPNDLATNSVGNLQFVNAGVREATLETDGRFFARGGFSVPYTIGTKVPVITLEAAETYGLFHTEGTPDIFSFEHGGTATQSFYGNGNATFTGIITSGDANATTGASAYQIPYSGSNIINIWGAEYSSGATAMSFAVRPNNAAAGWDSSAGNAAFGRAVFLMDSGGFDWLTASSATVAIGSPVTMTSRMTLSNAGVLNVPGNADFGAGIDVTGNITVTGTVDGRDLATDFIRANAADTFTGNLTASGADIFMADNTIDQPVIQDYAIESEAPTVSANAVTLTYANGPAFEVDLEPATGTVTITLSGGPPTGTYGEIIVKVQQDTTASRTITWAGGTFEWPGGTAPTMTATADAFDIYHFSTWDGGTTWWGSALQDMK